jgi:hypothetical protein
VEQDGRQVCFTQFEGQPAFTRGQVTERSTLYIEG